MNSNLYMQDYFAEIAKYLKSSGTNSRDSGSVFYSDSQLMQVDSEFSKSKKRSNSAKNSKMGQVG